MYMENKSTEQVIAELEKEAVWKFLQMVQDCEPLWALGVTDYDIEVFHKVRDLIHQYEVEVGRQEAMDHFMNSLGMDDDEYEAYCSGKRLD